MTNFRKVLAYIEAHPQEWKQGDCFACFMAHAARMEGRDQFSGSYSGCDFLGLNEDIGCRPIAEWIFDADRTLDDFRTVARRVYA